MVNVSPIVNEKTASQETGAATPANESLVRFPGGDVSRLRRDDFDRDVWCVLGLPIDISDVNQTANAIVAAARDNERLSFVTPNVNWLVRAARDETCRQEILNADLSVADGAPLALIARMLGAPITSRTAGSDVFDALKARAVSPRARLRVFFFGGRDGAAEAAAAKLNDGASGLEAVGWHNPGFGDVASMSDAETIEKINAAQPDFLVVALGAAKGQAWIEANKDRLSCPAMAHLGAVIDFAAGGIDRAPAWVRKLGLEWAWRIKEEPSLWARYFKDAVGLGGLSVSRIAPQMLTGRAKPAAGANVSATSGPAGKSAVLSGDLSADGNVRKTFRALCETPGDVILDCQAVKSMDRAFLGLVLMLEKHLAARGAVIRLRGANRRIRSLLRANGMNYERVEMSFAPQMDIESQESVAI